MTVFQYNEKYDNENFAIIISNFDNINMRLKAPKRGKFKQYSKKLINDGPPRH